MNVRLWLNTNFVCSYACFKQNDASHDICIKYTKQDSLLLKNRRSGREREIFAFFFFSRFSLVNVINAIALWYLKKVKQDPNVLWTLDLAMSLALRASNLLHRHHFNANNLDAFLGLPSSLCIQEPSVLSKELFLYIKHTNLFVRGSIFMSF